jgi:hypothetical protein
MKTKREVLEEIAKNGKCANINCIEECPYCFYDRCPDLDLRKIGAMAILRMFPEKREFDPDKILTCVTADKAKVGMKGYFGDNIASLRTKFEKGGQISELIEILDEKNWCRFRYSKGIVYALFYPIDEVEE